MPLRTIKGKIIVSVSLIVLLGGILTASGVGWSSYNNEVSHAKEKLGYEAHDRAEKVAAFLDYSTGLSENLAADKEIWPWLEKIDQKLYIEKNPSSISDQKKINEILKNFSLKNRYSNAYLTDGRGLVVASSDGSLIGFDFNSYPFFKKSILGYIGMGAVYDPSIKSAFLYISQAVKNDNNQIIGTLTIKISTAKLKSVLDESVADENILDMISDENGIIISSTDSSRLYKSLGSIDEMMKRKLVLENTFPGISIVSLGYDKVSSLIAEKRSEEASESYKDNGHDLILSVVPIGKYPIYLVSETDMNLMNETAKRLALLFFLPIAATIIIIIIFIYYLLIKILKPIDILKNKAKNIGLGNFEQKKVITTGDELEDLEEVMIRTSEQLKSAYSEMESKVYQRTAEIQAKNIQAEKANIAMANIMEDIEHERDKVESLAKDLEKFKLALDNTSEQVIIADRNGIILYVNKGMEKITGYKIEEAMGKKTADLWRIIRDEKEEEKMWNELLNKKKAISREMPSRKKDGTEYTTMTAISPILSNEGEVEYVISISHDITKEKEIDRAKTEFVSLASHQLRTPLSSVNWYSEMLLAGDAGKMNDDQTSFVNEIYKGNKRMVDLVNSLLDVSRLELGTFSINPEVMDICEPAQSVINELKPGLATKKMEISMNCQPGIPKIKADPKLTRIIFQNLLSNAVKYTPEGGKVSVNMEANKEFVIIKVKDTGYGIPENQKDKIFSKLFRADNVKAKDTEGTGLGLYIVKSILDSSGGSIEFESKEDEGTTFIVHIPLKGMAGKKGSKTLGE